MSVHDAITFSINDCGVSWASRLPVMEEMCSMSDISGAGGSRHQCNLIAYEELPIKLSMKNFPVCQDMHITLCDA